MTDPNLVAEIRCNGQRYTAWQTMTVKRDFHNGVSTFQFSASEVVSSGQGWSSVRLNTGDAVQIYLGGALVITGYITSRVAAFESNSHELVIAGKSLTMDVHDSSVVIKPGTYNGTTFEQAARGVLAPHPVGLKIINPPSIVSKPFKSLSVQYGETCGEFISRIANMRGLIISDDENGNVVAGQGDPTAASVAELVEGKNILRATAQLDNQTAFSKYQVAGQNTGDDSNWPPRDNSATVTNPNARPNRYKLTMAENPGDAEDFAQRANFEMTHSQWTYVRCTVTVTGWKKPSGDLWKPTDNITISSPMLFPNESGSMTLGVQSVTYAQDSQNGTTTTMECVLPWMLTTAPDPGVRTDGAGNPITDPLPNQAQPDTPDTGG